MGELKERRIIQIQTWLDKETVVIPDADYKYDYPKTVYDAVHQTMDDTSPTLTEELISIYRLINERQTIIGGGAPGNIMTFTGIDGQIGSMEVAKVINPTASVRSNSKIPTERAIGTELDQKVNVRDFNTHINDMSMHVTDVERARWNQAASASSLSAHASNTNVHVTPEEKARWNDKASQSVVDDHIYDTNNPHNVTAHQVGSYTRNEIDTMFENIRESFFNYQNIYWDDRDGSAKLIDYHPSNWNPNYVLQYGDMLPDVPDKTAMYFAIIPATDHNINETQDVIIYVKRPGMAWQEAGLQSMNMGDMVIRYPDTTMYVWTQGRFMPLFTAANDPDVINENDKFWKPQLDENGVLTWVMSKDKTPPDPVTIKGKDGYVPQKGVDYVDGKDGVGVPVGGSLGDILLKLSDENYDTTWKSLKALFDDLVLSGIQLPDGLVSWDKIEGIPAIYDAMGTDRTGLMSQEAITKQFEIVSNNISMIQEMLQGMNQLDGLYDHVNDYNNPHRVTANQIGAVSTALFTAHTQNFNNPHQLTLAQLGAGNIDNTSDMDKPVSRAQQAAIDKVVNMINNVTGNVDDMNYIANVTWDNSKVNLDFIFKDGDVLGIHIPIAEIFSNIYFDKVERDLVIVLPDGNEHRVPIGSMIVPYLGSISDNVQVVVENNTIKAMIIPGTIGEDEIQVSVHLKGSPTTTTQPVNDRSTRIATTEFAKAIVIDTLVSHETDRPGSANMLRVLNERKADVEDVIQIINDLEGIEVMDNLDSTSPLAALSANMGRYLDEVKAPRVHTSPTGSTFGRATVALFGHARATDEEPLMDGTVSKGTDDGTYARGTHRHPTDITRAPMHWPDNEHNQIELTGEPKTVIPPDDSNDHRIANTEWVRRNTVGVNKGECYTAGNNPNKVASLRSTYMNPVVFLRQIGSAVSLTFTNEDISGSATTTLDVQGSGPAKVLYAGKELVNGMLGANYEHLFIFDGENWKLINPVPATGLGTITIGPGPSATTMSLRREAGHNGYTIDDGKTIDVEGNTNLVNFMIQYAETTRNVDIEVSNEPDAWAARMGDGRIIVLSDPVVIDQTTMSCVVQFTMSESYPSNSPCQLIYNTNQAYINITEVS